MQIARQNSLIVVEDAASSLGTTIHGRPTGVFGDIGFYSFNRGKNLSTLSGGCIVTDSEEMASAIKTECALLPELGFISKLKIAMKLIALALAVRPFFYTVFYDLISKLKYTAQHTDFDSFAYTRFQAGIGCALFGQVAKVLNKRYDHGTFLFDMLAHMKGIKLPELIPHAVPVFNQFPVLLKMKPSRKIVLKKSTAPVSRAQNCIPTQFIGYIIWGMIWAKTRSPTLPTFQGVYY